MRHSLHLALASAVVAGTLMASPDVAMAAALSASCPWTTSQTFSEAFTTTTYKDSATSAAGWGSGYVQLPPRSGGFPTRTTQH
ncbi:MAG TPA: hypothetical protein VFH51_04045, partial [Myxococcota bacterium]|nr:hypothetical protein [Myxococcota bacterium]